MWYVSNTCGVYGTTHKLRYAKCGRIGTSARLTETESENYSHSGQAGSRALCADRG